MRRIASGVVTMGLATALAVTGVTPVAAAAPARTGQDHYRCETKGNKRLGDPHVNAWYTVRWHRDRQNNRLVDWVHTSGTKKYARPNKGGYDRTWTLVSFTVLRDNGDNPKVYKGKNMRNQWTAKGRPVTGRRVSQTKAITRWRVQNDWGVGWYSYVHCTTYLR